MISLYRSKARSIGLDFVLQFLGLGFLGLEFLGLGVIALTVFGVSLFGPTPIVRADDEVYSGPQIGEKLSPFTVRMVFGDEAGEDVDFVTQTRGEPLVLIFVHDVNRQSISMTRILSKYSQSRKVDGLHTGIVWLDDDVTEAENTLKRIRHALTPEAPIGISVDGREGPGSYGLNRNVMLTILVGRDGKVTSNFALIQPSLQADLPKILESIVALVGGPLPKLDELLEQGGMRGMAAEPDPNLRPLLRPVIQRNATVEQVDLAAHKVEAYVSEHPAARTEVGRIAHTIISAGKLENYGTPHAQEYLKKWAKEYGPTASESESESKKEKEAAPSTGKSEESP